MRPRLILLLLLVVAAAHLLIYGFTRVSEVTAPARNEPADRANEPSSADPAPSVAESPVPESPEISEEPASDELDLGPSNHKDSVSRAVDLVQAAGREESDEAEPSGDATSLSPEAPGPSTAPDAIPEGSMKLGRVTGQSKLPPHLTDLAQKGALAVAAGNWKEARTHYLKLVREAPGNALAHANLGVAEHQLGNLLAASGNLRKSLDINPSIAQNWQTLGLIHYERGELELAISTLSRAIHEEPSNARSRLFLAAVVRDYGWHEAAIIELQRAVETDPKLAEAHFNLALTYLEENPPRLELAKRHYYSALDLGTEPSPEIEERFGPKNKEKVKSD